MKFAVGFVVPYPTRIRRVASYYQRGGRIISIYDTVTLIIIVALIVPLSYDLSFITGLIVGMLVIQILTWFSAPLPEDRAPESSSAKANHVLRAQAHPGLAWREIVLMSLFCWALYALIAPGRLVPRQAT